MKLPHRFFDFHLPVRVYVRGPTTPDFFSSCLKGEFRTSATKEHSIHHTRKHGPQSDPCGIPGKPSWRYSLLDGSHLLRKLTEWSHLAIGLPNKAAMARKIFTERVTESVTSVTMVTYMRLTLEISGCYRQKTLENQRALRRIQHGLRAETGQCRRDVPQTACHASQRCW